MLIRLDRGTYCMLVHPDFPQVPWTTCVASMLFCAAARLVRQRCGCGSAREACGELESLDFWPWQDASAAERGPPTLFVPQKIVDKVCTIWGGWLYGSADTSGSDAYGICYGGL